MRELIAALRADPRCAGVRVLVGGRPFTINPRLADLVGADAWAPGAREALDLCSELDGGQDRCRLRSRGTSCCCASSGRINSELASQRRPQRDGVHDLSNPAQVIMGLSELLLEHPGLDPMVRARVEQLHRSALTMGP